MPIDVKRLGLQEYAVIWRQMQSFSLSRTALTEDQIWIVEHPPVYTQGLNGKAEHLLQRSEIPIVKTDRGGQITYHGPGQLVVYLLVDIRRLHKGPRQLISILENAMITTLKQYGISAMARPDAPGVYVAEQKIGSVGLRIKQGCSYHGLSLNNQMDLSPFFNINPCGYPGLEVTQLADLGVNIDTHELAMPVVHEISKAISK
jgi:lipoyl(octanoyl) transferase